MKRACPRGGQDSRIPAGYSGGGIPATAPSPVPSSDTTPQRRPCSVMHPALLLPRCIIHQVLTFLDVEALTSCAQVCLELYELTSHPTLWEAVALHGYPHISLGTDLARYSLEHKTLLLDRNRRNHSIFFDWLVPDCVVNTKRRYSPVFTIEDYSFQMIVDPSGNPFVPLARPGVSLYLSCCPTSELVGLSPDGGRMETRQSTWECCVGFTLCLCNRKGNRKGVAWASNLDHDRFSNEVKEWGVHRLLSLRRIRDPENGYMEADGCIKVQARVRLLYIRLRVLTSRMFATHHGFGLFDPLNCKGKQAMTYKLFECTRLSALRSRVANDLGLSSPSQLRLWVVTQPWAELTVAPRELLVDREHDSPTLAHVLQGHTDGVGEVRLWAEWSGDSGLTDSGAGSGPCRLLAPTLPGEPLPTVSLLPDSNDPNHLAAAAAAGLAVPAVDGGDDGNNHSNLWVLLFLKWLVPGQCKDGLTYLTHVTARADMPLRCLFEAVAAQLGEQLEGLRAYLESPPAHWQQGRDGAKCTVPLRVLDCPRGEDTLRSLKIENGHVMCFFRAGEGMYGELKGAYQGLLRGLLRDLHDLYETTAARSSVVLPAESLGGRPAGRRSRVRPQLKFDQVVDTFERLGHQRFRIRNTFFEQKHQNARETLEFALKGRHLGFCCDRCGATDFVGRRSKCASCWDFDLCHRCHELPVESHRYRFEQRLWIKEEFKGHSHDHNMYTILAIPYEPFVETEVGGSSVE